MSDARCRLADALAMQARHRAGELAMQDEQLRLTWGEVSKRAIALAAQLPKGPIGLYGDNGCEWALTLLAALLSGRTLVPLPTFFSAAQRQHVIQSAHISAIVKTTGSPWLSVLGDVAVIDFDSLSGGDKGEASGGHGASDDAVLVFTSGSTGNPKGVRLTLGNLLATADALIEAVHVTCEDSYLSVLPLAMLLEQICAVLVPVLTGAKVTFSRSIPNGVAAGEPVDLAGAIANAAPSIMVLVPQLLSLLVAQVNCSGARDGLASLRFVAIGGASPGAAALAEARAIGLPAYEGYGLTECASVVALNTPDDDRLGTAGRPLAGRHVEIVDGEIVVSGPSVMAGYLGAPDLVEGRWSTGDVGEIAADGSLIVRGRKDNLIVCSNGRNVSPEWVETAILAMPGIQHAIVCPTEHADGLAALLIADWAAEVRALQLDALSERLAEALPRYARPSRFSTISSGEARSLGIYRMGKPNRQLARTLLLKTQPALGKEPFMSPYDRLLSATRIEREAFMRIPLVANAVAHGASREMYLAFLGEAYHHVKHTFPLLALTASLTKDARYREALAEYMEEEFGHEEWILDDIRRMGGDAAAVAASKPRLPCRVMVAHTYYAVQWESPYAMLGMVHVLEGLSVLLADKLAGALKTNFATASEEGFSYLRTHGALDVEHTAMFQRLIDGFEDPAIVDLVIEQARIMYQLYGAIFEDLSQLEHRRAA